NEAVLIVGGSTSCSGPAGVPSQLRFIVVGSTVTLTWDAASGSPTSYIVEAGSRSGMFDLAVIDTGSLSTSMTATNVSSGTYFVRARARNICGTSDPSNEIVVAVP